MTKHKQFSDMFWKDIHYKLFIQFENQIDLKPWYHLQTGLHFSLVHLLQDQIEFALWDELEERSYD